MTAFSSFLIQFHHRQTSHIDFRRCMRVPEGNAPSLSLISPQPSPPPKRKRSTLDKKDVRNKGPFRWGAGRQGNSTVTETWAAWRQRRQWWEENIDAENNRNWSSMTSNNSKTNKGVRYKERGFSGSKTQTCDPINQKALVNCREKCNRIAKHRLTSNLERPVEEMHLLTSSVAQIWKR